MNLIDKNTGEFLDTSTIADEMRDTLNQFKNYYHLTLHHHIVENQISTTAFFSCTTILNQLINEVETNCKNLEEDVISKYKAKEPIPRRKNQNTFLQLSVKDLE